MRDFVISVARDFSPHPGPRYIRQGKYSGEKFREVLTKALRQHERVVVDLDGTSGFGSSFLDEAFGGLVSKEHFPLEDIRKKLVIRSLMDASYTTSVEEAFKDALRQVK